MPASNLAKVFGPTIVGYSSTEAEPMKMFAETAKQAKVRLSVLLGSMRLGFAYRKTSNKLPRPLLEH